MKIGAMNHPARDVISEIRWMAEMKLDFIDLTLEPPAACTGVIDVAAVKRALDDSGLGIVGHTAYYLPFCSPFKALRHGATEEFKRCIEIFGELGSKWVNVHPDRHAPFHDRAFMIEMNLECFTQVMPCAKASERRDFVGRVCNACLTGATLAFFSEQAPLLTLVA